jgi:hypothetical protein
MLTDLYSQAAGRAEGCRDNEWRGLPGGCVGVFEIDLPANATKRFIRRVDRPLGTGRSTWLCWEHALVLCTACTGSH